MWIDHVRGQIALVAENVVHETAVRIDLPLLSSSVSRGVLQVGDSAHRETYRAVGGAVLTGIGEFASTIYFVTDDPEPQVRIVRMVTDYDALDFE